MKEAEFQTQLESIPFRVSCAKATGIPAAMVWLYHRGMELKGPDKAKMKAYREGLEG